MRFAVRPQLIWHVVRTSFECMYVEFWRFGMSFLGEPSLCDGFIFIVYSIERCGGPVLNVLCFELLRTDDYFM